MPLNPEQSDLVSSTAFLAALGEQKAYGLFVSGAQGKNFFDVLGEANYFRFVYIMQRLAWDEAEKGMFSLAN